MLKARLHLMIQDPATARLDGLPALEGFDVDREEFLLDGPVAKRVAILDFDPQTGMLAAPVPFVAAPPGRALARYQIAKPDDIYGPDVIRVSAFATVLRTIYLFEDEDALGRPLTWAFEAPQLFIVPRAGQLENAFYERESHSIQFFFFPSPVDARQTIFTSLSRDIVSHETGHAILDGIAPDLYNCLSPQSLGLHEAVADLTALLMAFSSHTLRERVLAATGGSIRESSAFSSVAEEFGSALDSHAGYLRSLLNDKTLDPQSPNCAARDEPHELSEVLSGALYTVMVKIHESLKGQLATTEGRTEYQVSGKALALGANRFKQMALRALDYLPPGEISFADYGRAIVAANQGVHPGDEAERGWLCEEFVRRAIVADASALDVPTNLAESPLAGIDLHTLVESDWAAYEFANRNREFLGIPPGRNFRVRPRAVVNKLSYDEHGPTAAIHEILFKVSWDRQEPNPPLMGIPPRRQVTVGTTLVIDESTGRVWARLISDSAQLPEEAAPETAGTEASGAADVIAPPEQQADRDRLLRRLVREGALKVGAQAMAPNGRWLRAAVRAETLDGLMRVRGSARLLHVVKAT
jgi:hypothetical protein